MAGLRGLFKARLYLSLAADYRDLAFAAARRHGYTLGAAGFAPIITHTDPRHRRGRRRVEGRIDRSRPVDRDRGAWIVRDADVAARVTAIVPGGERISPPARNELPVMAVMALHQVRKRPADMGMHRKRPGDRRREGARDRAEGAAVASERCSPGAGHERRTMDHGGRSQAPAETAEAPATPSEAPPRTGPAP